MTLRILFCLLALLLGSAHAQGAPGLQPTDPSAPVPPVTYRSVLTDLPKGVEAGRENWKTANDNVGRFKRGHIDILKWEQQQEAPTAKPDNAPAAVAHPHKH